MARSSGVTKLHAAIDKKKRMRAKRNEAAYLLRGSGDGSYRRAHLVSLDTGAL